MSPARATHILDEDLTGGGHRWPGLSGKTSFPAGWSEQKILRAIEDVATDPALTWAQQTGVTGADFAGEPVTYVVYGGRDGVRIKVVAQPGGGGVVTAHPM